MPADAHDLARAVARLNRRLRQERQSELTPTQLSVLGTIKQLGSSTPGQVAAHERVQPPSLTRTMTGLLDLGLVVREPHPDDGRQVLVSISEQGIAVLTAERERRDAWLHRQLTSLPAGERDTLLAASELLERLADAE